MRRAIRQDGSGRCASCLPSLPFVPFGDSDKVRPGDRVTAIGNLFGFDTSVSRGIVSAVNRDIMESPFDDYIQTDAAINHGTSGGPLLNTSGEVIGMTRVIWRGKWR
jgi:serine protease Do